MWTPLCVLKRRRGVPAVAVQYALPMLKRFTLKDRVSSCSVQSTVGAQNTPVLSIRRRRLDCINASDSHAN